MATVGRGDFSSKPRPSLVVQANAFNDFHPAIIVCPITSVVTGDALYRIPIDPDDLNNLLFDSEIQIDLVQAERREKVGRVIGTASDDVMILVSGALRRWLAL